MQFLRAIPINPLPLRRASLLPLPFRHRAADVGVFRLGQLFPALPFFEILACLVEIDRLVSRLNCCRDEKDTNQTRNEWLVHRRIKGLNNLTSILHKAKEQITSQTQLLSSSPCPLPQVPQPLSEVRFPFVHPEPQAPPSPPATGFPPQMVLRGSA